MNIKSFFFKEDEPAPVVEKSKEAPKPAPTYNPTVATMLSSVDYNKYFADKMKENNQPGPDYYEFSEAIRALDNVPLSEEQKYQVTFPTYLSMGINADKLITSAQAYITLLDKEDKDFKFELNQTKEKEVNAKQAKIKELQTKNEELTKQIQDNALKIQTFTLEANKASESLNVEQNAFEVALNNAKTRIQDQITKIKTYLNANVTK
jgi:hypothetical protein